jgi:transcriptional regulator with XRE-family HTH domain
MSSLGTRIRELRQSRNLTLEQVATDTGLSVSFLSMVERDKVSISVDNLEKLGRYYEVHMVHFFTGPEASPVLITRRANIVKSMVETGSGPAAVTLLANRPNARMEPLLVHIAPGKEEPHFRKHEADSLVYILEGQARLIPEGGGEEIVLNQGDLAYYRDRPQPGRPGLLREPAAPALRQRQRRPAAAADRHHRPTDQFAGRTAASAQRVVGHE